MGKSEANCRQVLHRAHRHIDQGAPRFDVSYEQQERITRQFMRASTSGDMHGLLNMLTDDIVYIGDGGGKVPTALKPIRGVDKVVRGTFGGLQKLATGIDSRIEQINGQPAIVGYVDDRPYGVVLLEIQAETVRAVYAVLNPDKLHWIGKEPPPI